MVGSLKIPNYENIENPPPLGSRVCSYPRRDCLLVWRVALLYYLRYPQKHLEGDIRLLSRCVDNCIGNRVKVP